MDFPTTGIVEFFGENKIGFFILRNSNFLWCLGIQGSGRGVERRNIIGNINYEIKV